MRILQILEATLGGTARHVLDLCRGLRKIAHEVHLLYNPDEGRMDNLFRRGLRELEAAGVVAVPVAMERAVGPMDFRSCISVRRYLRDHGPFDVIHGHSSKAGAFARLGTLGLPGMRVYTPHAFMTANPDLGAGGRLLYGAAERVLGKLSHAVLCVSDDERQEAIRLGIPSRKLFIIPNGANMPQEPVASLTRREFGIPAEAVVAGYVGRFVPQKDPENLVRAFAHASGRAPELRLAMVGYGPLEGSCRDLAEKLRIAHRIHWLGAQEGPAAMKLFDFFCLPSQYEGMPYVLIEAMVIGLPILTTRIGGAAMLVEEGVNGSIVPPRDPLAFGEAMAKMGSDPEKRSNAGKQSIRRATLFSVERMISEIEGVYMGRRVAGLG